MMRYILDFFTLFAFRIIVGELLFCLGFKKRSHFGLRLVLGLGMFWGSYFLMPGFYFMDVFYIGWYNCSWLFMFFASIGLIYFCFDLSVLNAIFYGSAAYAAENMLHNIIFMIRENLFSEEINAYYYLLIFGLTILVYTGLYFIQVRRQQREPVTMDQKTLVYFPLITMIAVNLLSWWTDSRGETNLANRICMAWMDLLLLSIQFGLFERARIEQENEVMQLIFQENEKLHEASKENIDLINRKCHDLKHQIHAIRRSYAEGGSLEELDEIESAVKYYDLQIDTGNQALDTILVEKNLLCEKHQIKFSYMIDSKPLAFMKPIDIYSLFGNLLDNAIESALREDETEKRFIVLRMEHKGNLLSIHMENSCPNQVEFVEGLPVSVKVKNGYHGFGTKSIQYVVENYHGDFKMNQEGERFLVDILFYLQRV